MKAIKWSIEYWKLVEFDRDSLRHWWQVLLSGDFD